MRVQSALILADFKAKKAIEPLARLFQDKEKFVRCAAAVALGKIGDRDATPALIKALSDTEEDVRLVVVDALEKIKDVRALEPLKKVAAEDPSDAGAGESPNRDSKNRRLTLQRFCRSCYLPGSGSRIWRKRTCRLRPDQSHSQWIFFTLTGVLTGLSPTNCPGGLAPSFRRRFAEARF